jgi:hypothetical protein
MPACTYCGSERVISTSDGYKCRTPSCAGAKTVMHAGVLCDGCQTPMDYKGLNAWGEPSYRCPQCGQSVKL